MPTRSSNSNKVLQGITLSLLLNLRVSSLVPKMNVFGEFDRSANKYVATDTFETNFSRD